MANADKAISRREKAIPQHGPIRPGASSLDVELAVALVCLSCVFFTVHVQDVFSLPKVWMAGLGVLVGLWGRRRC